MRGFKYILFVLALTLSVGAWGQYNPSNPAEPGAPVKYYTLTLQADPSGGGSFNLNATSAHAEGETFWVQANTVSNFTFVEWTLDDEVVSTNYRFQYTMPDHDVTLIAHFRYTPSSPVEPSFPDKPIYSNLWLTAHPSGGGSFNISSGTSYEVGASVRVQATPASNFTFLNWTQDGEVISESRTFNYVMQDGIDSNHLVANFIYTPGNPDEPIQRVYHRVYLMADPLEGGYFNTESGNKFEEGTQQTFRAYNNQWYTFQNWTIDGEVISTSSNYTLTIPNKDVTLTAHYTYNYDPNNPVEPNPSTTPHLIAYGMTASGVRSQAVIYPVFLENTEDVYGMTVVLHFPEGFTVNTTNVVQAERAAGHSLVVTDIGNNAYRFDLTGEQPLTGQNGKIFDVPVTIGTDLEPDRSYQVVLTNAARINQDGSKDVFNTRNGYIFVEDMKEDGLYAQFIYEKLQSRVQFNNLSSDVAVSYKWDFGDGSTSTEKNPLHIYSEPGYYDVTLTAYGQTGSDVAKMTVLINERNTWVVDGVFFLDTEVKGVRYFSSAQELFTYLSANPIIGNLKISVKPNATFDYALTEESLAQLATIQQQLADGGYILTIAKNGEGDQPVINFGTKGAAIDDNIVDLLVSLGENMVCDDVTLQLWAINFNPSKLAQLKGQTVLSGSATEEVDFTSVSTDLTFTWTASTETETVTGYLSAGEGNITSMTAMSGSAEDCYIIYNIIATYQGTKFLETTYTITLKPTLEGKFTDLLPVDGAELETTTVTLSWNHITNAVYDVYLWNAANQRPTTPVAEGISEPTYTSQNFCQNNRNYKWQVIARNAIQQMESDTMHFSVKMLPDLHIYSLQATTNLQAGRTVTIEWTVRNDGVGGTETQSWYDRLWLVPDVYGGTNQNSCKLLATIPNAMSLFSGEEYTGSTEVYLDDYSYGSYYLLVASDMSSVNLIDWTSIGGSIVNPYTPVLGGNAEEGTYAHLFATTSAEGNQLKEHGETNNRSDNFFYTKVEIAPPSVDEADWLILETAYHQMGDGEGWTASWNFDSESRSIVGLPGVQLRNGRVVGINLSANNLSCTFPMTLLKLPCLESLNLAGNALMGDVGQMMLAFMAQNPGTNVTVKTLNISNNKLSGNIGLFARYCPELVSLNAQSNKLEDVIPMISPKVTDLKLGKQKMDRVVSIHLNNLTAASVGSQMPTILFYKHASQTYSTDINLLFTTSDNSWEIQFASQNGILTMPYVSEQNTYYGQSGDTLNVAVVDANRQPEGSTFRLKLEFDQGDANFDGDIDVTDLQAIINYAFEDYKTEPFNYTASNLWTDDVINVQDVVRLTDVLLTMGSEPSGRKKQRVQENQDSWDSQACIYVKDGQVWIDTQVPVSAFELTLYNVNVQMKEMGFTCRSNSKDGIICIVAYSMDRISLPVGATAIADIELSATNDQSSLINAVLSDSKAKRIPVTILSSDDVTGCSDTLGNSNEDSATILYDLQGRRVNPQSQKGLYIQSYLKGKHGRKVLRK